MIVWTSKNGHLEVVKYLVKKGAYIHTKNLSGHHLEVVQFLVEKGADINKIKNQKMKEKVQTYIDVRNVFKECLMRIQDWNGQFQRI